MPQTPAIPSADELLSTLQALGEPKHIERERASKKLETLLKALESTPEEERCKLHDALEAGILPMLKSGAWEQRLAGLVAAKALVQTCRREGLEEVMLRECMQLLEDDEVRVRLAVGDCLHCLCTLRGVSVFESCCERVMLSISENFDRDGEGARARPPGEGQAEGPASPTASRPNSRNSSFGDLIGMLLQSTYKVTKPGTGELRHGSEGWHCLETSMRALGQMMEGCGDSIRPHITQETRRLVASAQHHPNRFVREIGHFMTSTVARVLRGAELAAVGQELAEGLADGLSDNWPQVRYAASVATRSFLQSLPRGEGDEAVLEPYMQELVPPLCLNRYFEAEGVRLYCQETWRLVMGERGRERVAHCISQVVAYYVAQSKSSNHGVREAACACIAELMGKVDRAAVAPFVEELLHALIICFKDMGWPVRDAACTAFGRCVLSHPEEAKPVLERELWDLWFAHLWENIPSVRQNTALAIANAIRSYGKPALDRVLPVVRDMLPRAHEQPPDQGPGSSGGPEGGRDAQRVRDNDPALHSGKDMFSCTTLLSRFGRDYFVKSDGCMDYGFSRDKQPWEASDGAVYMLRELSALPPDSLPEALDAVESCLPAVADLTSLRSFQHACHLRESVWRCLVPISKNLGKQRLRRHLDALLPTMFADLTCGHQLTEAAAGRCVVAMRALLGATMFTARLDDTQQELVRSNPNVLLAEQEAAGMPMPAPAWPRPPGAGAPAGSRGVPSVPGGPGAPVERAPWATGPQLRA